MLCCDGIDVKSFNIFNNASGDVSESAAGTSAYSESGESASVEYSVPLDKKFCKQCPQGHHLDHFCFPPAVNFNCDLCTTQVNDHIVFGCKICRFGICYDCHTKNPILWNVKEIGNWCKETNGTTEYGYLISRNKIDGSQFVNLNKKKLIQLIGLETIDDETIGLILNVVENVKRISNKSNIELDSTENQKNQKTSEIFIEKSVIWKTAQKCETNRNPFTDTLMSNTNEPFFLPTFLTQYT